MKEQRWSDVRLRFAGGAYVGMRDGSIPVASMVVSALSMTKGVLPVLSMVVSAASITEGGSQLSWVDARYSRQWCST